MARFNRFGAVYTLVTALYPGADLTDYDDGGANGQTRIESVLDRIARKVASAFTPEVYRQITQVDCMEAVRYATAGQTTATLGRPEQATATNYLVPLVAGTVHLWQYPNPELLNRPNVLGGGLGGASAFSSDFYTRKPAFGINELSGYAVTAATGAVTGLALNLGDRLFASYDVDVDSASFSLPSVADVVAMGTAAECGGRLYSEGMNEWKLVEQYRTDFAAMLERITDGEWVPDELRSLRYWTDVERKSDEVRSVRLYRG